MKRSGLFLIGFITIIFLTACGGGLKNDTPVTAAKTLMRGLNEGDRELIDEINRSGDYFPIDYLLDVTRPLNIKDVDNINDFKFVQDKDDENIVTVNFKDCEGIEHFIKLLLSDEKDEYFFVNIEDYGSKK